MGCFPFWFKLKLHYGVGSGKMALLKWLCFGSISNSLRVLILGNIYSETFAPVESVSNSLRVLILNREISKTLYSETIHTSWIGLKRGWIDIKWSCQKMRSPCLSCLCWKNMLKYFNTRSLGALQTPTSRLRPFGLALGHSGLLDNVHATVVMG